MSDGNKLQKKMNRRRFLHSLTALSAGLLAACAGREIAGEPTPFRTQAPARLVDIKRVPITGSTDETAPQASATPASPGGAAGEAMTLEQFMEFSRLLTGVDKLDPALGQIYLGALRAGAGSGSALASAYSAASSGSNSLPQDAQALTDAGFFEQEGMRDLAVLITDMWYSGVYQLNGEDQVATTADALAWKVLNFTKPITICGAFGFWATDPKAQISPNIQYTPVPAPAQ
jgi:hypothetical protein